VEEEDHRSLHPDAIKKFHVHVGVKIKAANEKNNLNAFATYKNDI